MVKMPKFDWFLGRPHLSIVFYNDNVNIISCHIDFKFAYFVELDEGYQPTNFQCCRLSGSSFTERLQKHNDSNIMTSFQTFGI